MQKEKIKVSQKLADAIIEGMQENKAKDIVLIDLRKIDSSVCDFFVICTGESSTQINGISAAIQRFVRKSTEEKPWHIEGSHGSHWILLDYVNVVAHIFNQELRAYYDLEDLWADAKITQVPELF